MSEQARPEVSVLMVVFNGLPHVHAAVESVLSQSWSDLELVIVDDGSSDGTSTLLETLRANDQRVRVLRNPENRGRSFSSWLGLRSTRAPLVARLDADDIALPDRLKKQVEFLREHPEVDVLGTWATEIDESGRPLAVRTMPSRAADVRRLIWANPIIHSSVLYRRDRILEVGSYDVGLAHLEDYDLWFRCAASGLVMVNLPEPLVLYRVSEAQFKKRRRKAWRTSQLHVGWRGCRRLGLGIGAYLAVTAPVAKSLVPERFSMAAQRTLRRFDPRNRSMEGI